MAETVIYALLRLTDIAGVSGTEAAEIPDVPGIVHHDDVTDTHLALTLQECRFSTCAIVITRRETCNGAALSLILIRNRTAGST